MWLPSVFEFLEKMVTEDIVRDLEGKLSGVSSVLIVIGTPPVFDEVAAALSLRLGLMTLGKRVGVVCEAPMVVEFNRLVGVDKVKTEMGGENLIVKFSKMASEAIGKVSYEEESGTGRLMLVVMPKPGRTVPGRSHISFERSGASGEMVVAVGREWGKLEEKMLKVPKEKLVWVGREGGREGVFGLEIGDERRAAVSEVVAEVLFLMKVRRDEDLATNLFLGIEAGSRGFTARQVGPETFKLVAELLESGARRDGIGVRSDDESGDWMTPRVYKGGMLV